MKIRTSYVSNSSSSSFIAVVKPINSIKRVTSKVRAGDRVLVVASGGGTSGDAEDWLMELFPEAWERLKASSWFSDQQAQGAVKFYDIIISNVDGGYLTVSERVQGQLVVFQRDYSSPNSFTSLEDFLNRVEH